MNTRFFFQAEDGIRDGHVTGVQTCALPISVRDIAVGVKEITLATADPQLPLPEWSAGAHIELMLPNGLERKYSLCPSQNPDHYVIADKLEEPCGGGSAWIYKQLSAGQKLNNH